MRAYSFPVEIHTHTNHSDANFTTKELVKAAKDFGYKGIILTDHNSSSGYNELLEQGLTQQEDFVLLKGMEWTTYFGHMLVHNAAYDVDWREATPDTIDPYIQEVKDAGGLVGIAHPFDMGSPICTGCHWEFDVKKYENVDYIEIWNSNMPHIHKESEAAYEMWLKRLDEGYQISASTGRDWHRPDDPNEIMGVTYIETNEEKLTEENFIQALEKGRFYITLGPTSQFYMKDQPEETVQMGGVVNLSTASFTDFSFEIAPAEIEWLKKFSVSDTTFTLYNNRDTLYEENFPGKLKEIQKRHVKLNEELKPGYLRYELTGTIENNEQVRLIISNPIYLED